MKSIYTAFALLISVVAFGQNITLSLENAQITNDGSNAFYEVDVMISADQNYTQGTGQFFIDYNTAAFGPSIFANNGITYERPTNSILGSQSFTVDNYSTFIVNDNTASTVSLLWQQFWSAGTIGTNVTNTPSLLVHIKMELVSTLVDPGVCLNTTDPFDDQFFTACGPFTPSPAGADCINSPGTQLLNYTPDCTNAGIDVCSGTTTTWNGTAWDNGTPDSTMSVVISGNYDSSTNGNLEGCELTIQSSATVTVQAGGYLNIQNHITVDGSLIVQHQGSVVQVSDLATVTNNGTINVNMTTPVLQTRDFMVMGSPMTAETRTGVYNSAFLVLQHTPSNFIPHPGVPAGGTNFADDNGDFWSQFATGPINVGEGYIVRPQSSYTDPANTTYSFTHSTGTLNNGVVTRSIVFNGLAANPDGTPNVLSNPYPSAISANDLINTNTLITEVYFWEHLTPPGSTLPGAGGYNFDMDDISMYNLSGGVAAANDTGTSTQPNGLISTGQGFGVKARGAGTVEFNNSMRRTTGNNTLRNPDEGLNKIWLQVSSPDYELRSNTLVAFNPVASPDIDPGYDSDRIATIISLFSHLEDGSEELGIQTLEAFDTEMKVPMGFASQVDEFLSYTISIVNTEGGEMANATVFLADNLLNTVTNLTDQDYSFTSSKGTFPNRFTLFFENEAVLNLPESHLSNIAIYPNPVSDILNVVSPLDDIKGLTLYDISGRIVHKQRIDQTHGVIDLSALPVAIYLLEVTTQQGTTTKKIVKR